MKTELEDLFSCPHHSIKALQFEADGTVFGKCEACGDSSFLISEPCDWVIEAKQDLNNLHTLMQTIRFALSPEGGEKGWRPPHGVDPLVDLALEVREQMELARKNRDKTLAAMEHTEAWYATRIRRLEDLCKQHGCWTEAAAILANGSASPTEPRTYEQLLNVAQSRAEKAEANYAHMVERAANQRLDGYRELGARAAAAENEADRLRGEANVANALHRELNDLFGWGDESMLHALAHVRNAVLNLRADLRTERFLRENADKLAASQVKEGTHEAVVAYLRAQAEIAYDNSDAHHALWCAAEAIERGEHHKGGG